MSSYTTQLKTLVEQASQYEEGLSTREKIENGRKKLFDFEYPIFDEDYRKVFETHFIRKFYMREIGFETEGLFKFYLETWLSINMPYWNKMFESELIEYDPLVNSHVDVSHTKKNDTTQTSKSDGNRNSENEQQSETEVNQDNFNRSIDSDNPDSRLSLTANDGEGVIEYASKISEDNENNVQKSNGNATSNSNDTTSVTSNADINEIEDYIQHRTGKIGVQSYSKMIMEYRQSLLRVEEQMFQEMNQLFMLVY